MWQAQTQRLDGKQARKVSIVEQGQPLSYAQVIDQWQHSELFRDFFISLLATAPFPAYFWETPPVTQASQTQPFEFVLVNNPQLATVQANPSAFRSHFDRLPDTETVVSFANLGGDAFLVVPTPPAAAANYAHLAAFTNQAPRRQQQALWQQVGLSLQQRLSRQPVWLSTSGLGVYWLHIRLDSRPKYYTHAPYRHGR